jgi:hypothetical protein
LKSNIWKNPIAIATRTDSPMNSNQPATHRAVNYIKTHEASLALLLAAYGAFFLAVVIMGGWTLLDWGKDTFKVAPFAVHALLPRSYISPLFFATSFPVLLIGVAILCLYSIRNLNKERGKEYVAILLTVCGFAYIVVGAWPLQSTVDLPWEWQKQIMSYGLVFAWMLYALGLAVLAVGCVSLFMHSREYRRRHPELSEDIKG